MGFAHGARLEQTFACPAVRVLPCQTLVPNVRHVVPARHDAYALWERPLDISEGLRPSVKMQWNLSEVLLGAQKGRNSLTPSPSPRGEGSE